MCSQREIRLRTYPLKHLLPLVEFFEVRLDCLVAVGHAFVKEDAVVNFGGCPFASSKLFRLVGLLLLAYRVRF